MAMKTTAWDEVNDVVALASTLSLKPSVGQYWFECHYKTLSDIVQLKLHDKSALEERSFLTIKLRFL